MKIETKMKKRDRRAGIVGALLLFAVSGSLLARPSFAGSLGPRLRYLRHVVATGRIAPAPPRVAVTLEVGPDFAIATLPAGVELRRDARGVVLRSARVVPVLATLAVLDELAAGAGIVRVETDWFPRAPIPPLDLSRPEIESPLVWPERDASGLPLTGAGVVIADLDSGVDVFHPHMFFPDGGRFAWIDVDGSGDLTLDVDAVDLDGDLSADPGEILRVLETPLAASYPSANPPGYDLDLDWLYADRDASRAREFGRGAGFDDASPSFGEPLFFADDVNRSGTLGPGEELVGLGTSKVKVVRERDGRLRRRGVDLIDSEGDSFISHGSWVTGILAGGIAGVSRFAGQAPAAELIVANMYYPSVPPFEDDMASLALWAKSEGARVILYESGNWVWAYLDGSHATELAMTDLAGEGYLQVTPNGNLGGGGQTQTKFFAAATTDVISATTPGSSVTVVWPSLLWRGDVGDAVVSLELPGPLTLAPCYCATTETVGGFTVYSDSTQSSRGTTMLNFEIRAASGPVSGQWRFRVTPTRDLTVHGYSWDDRSGWSGTTRWDQADDLHTVTQPATGDGSIAIAAYSPRSCGGCTPPGQLNGFSGRGTRIDGVSVVDLATPGSRVYSTAPKESIGLGGITGFGGTSSALPHATGAAALLVQLNPNDPHAVIERILRETALEDGFTGPVPNEAWGMGKLRLAAAYAVAARPSLLRDDGVSALVPRPDIAARFPDSGVTTLDLTGANGYSHEGEGLLLSSPGTSDGDAFLAAHVSPGWVDPEGPALIADSARPLVFYQLTGSVVLQLTRDGSGVVVRY